MNQQLHKLRLLSYTVFIFTALVIIVDFVLPGSVVSDEIIQVKRDRQQYFNAGGNYHYSFKVVTSADEFSISDEFAAVAKEHEKIEYSNSSIFNEVNWYRQPIAGKQATYSLRIMSGLIIPLLTIISIVLAYQFKMKIGTLVFVLETLLIVDLVYLLN